MGRAPKVCASRGCIGDADVKSGKCVDHREAPWVRSTRRDKVSASFRRNRLIAKRSTNGRCAFCGDRAVAVDHRLPVAWGGTDEVENLQPMCDRQHREKTAQEAVIGATRMPADIEAHVDRWTPPIFRYRT